MEATGRILSVQGAAEYLGVKERTIRRYIADRKIKYSKSGSKIFIKESSLIEFINLNQVDDQQTINNEVNN